MEKAEGTMSGRIQNGVRAVWQSLALALPIGLAGGVVGTAFHIAVEQVTELRAAQGWLLWLLPIAGLGITALYQVLRCQGLGTDDVLRTVQQGKPLPLALTPAIFLGAVLTHLCGGSAGREGAALQMGGSIGWTIGSWEKQSPAGRRCAAVCGMAALFSALFGTPMASALFAVTVAQVGGSFAPALAPSLVAALIASGVSSAAGIAPTAFRVVMPALTWQTALQAGLLGAACAVVTRGFCWVLHETKHLLAHWLPNLYFRAAAGRTGCGRTLLAAGRAVLRCGHERDRPGCGAGTGSALGLCLQSAAHCADPGGRVQRGRSGAQLFCGRLLWLYRRSAAGSARRGSSRRRPGVGVLRRYQYPGRLYPAGGGAVWRPGHSPLRHWMCALLLALRQPWPL